MSDEELCIHIEDIIQKHTRRHDDTPLDAAQEIVLGFKQAGLIIPPGWVAVPNDESGRNLADSVLPLAMIEAGADMHMQAHTQLQDYVAGETIDWDDSMIAVAVFRAMLAARPKGEGK